MSVSFNNTGTITRTAASSATTSFNVTAGGSNKVAFAVIAAVGTAGLVISTVTYGGVSMTSAGSAVVNSTGLDIVQIFVLVNPPTGANNLVITGNANVTALKYNVISFNGVNQTTPTRNYNTATGSSASAAVTITSDANDITISEVSVGQTLTNLSSTNQTSDGLSNTGVASGSDHCTTPAASITHTWTIASSATWCICGLSIVTAAYTSSLTDTITVTDFINRAITKKVTETLTLVETFNVNIVKQLSEVITLTESINRKVTVKFTELISILDIFIHGATFTKLFTEIIIINDIFAPLKKTFRYLRQYLNDPTEITQPTSPTANPTSTYEDTEYIKRYL